MVHRDLPLDGVLIDGSARRGSGEGRIGVHPFGPEQIERLKIIDLGHQPCGDHGVPTLDRIRDDILVNADLLPDVGPQAGSGDGERSLCFFGVDGQQRLIEHDLVTRSARHPNTKKEQDHQREHEPAPGVVDDLEPAVACVARAQLLFLKGMPTVHS